MYLGAVRPVRQPRRRLLWIRSHGEVLLLDLWVRASSRPASPQHEGSPLQRTQHFSINDDLSTAGLKRKDSFPRPLKVPAP